MTTLHLGVADIGYQDAPKPYRKAKKAGKQGKAQRASSPTHVSTGDVAEWLEKKYGVMQHFFDAHKTDIAKDLENSLGGALETLLMGGNPGTQVFNPATSKIEERFKVFLSSQEAERVGIVGAPTGAALRGVNHRMKSGYGARRPSFIDTGLYQATMKSWVD